MPSFVLPIAALVAASIAGTPVASRPPAHRASAAVAIVANDNEQPAGRRTADGVTLDLVTREGTWRPHGPNGHAYQVAAFAERGKAPTTPGPLIRVPVGTTVTVTVANTLGKTLWLYGLGAERGPGDSTAVAPGATGHFRFVARDVGMYWYLGRIDPGPIQFRLNYDAQLNGVIVVDPPGPHPADRIFAISDWAQFDSTRHSGLTEPTTLAFNGRTYPNTPRYAMTVGDTVRWRFVNFTGLEHPLHLHGSYFRVDAHGDGVRDSVYAPQDRRMAVTERVTGLQTTALTFAPGHPGNWIFHCHVVSHMTAVAAFENDRTHATPVPGMEHELGHLMQGLILQFTVRPRPGMMADAAAGRPMRLVIRSREKVYGPNVGYSVSREDPGMPADTGMHAPGPTLELVRGERVAVTLVNRSHEPFAMHWHGIELESFADGVPMVSGEDGHVLPYIPPGDSLTVRFTPPRAGSYMYHSHSNEAGQISSGLYGAIVVRDGAAARDTMRDRIVMVSDAGPYVNIIAPPLFPPTLVNGQVAPAPIDVPGGVPVRLRLMGIMSEASLAISLADGASPASWRIVAKDGFPTPASQQRLRPAQLNLAPGEIVDVEVTVPAGKVWRFRHALADADPKDERPVTWELRGN